MSVILILILASLTIALVFLAGFIWAVRSGQYEDTCTPSLRILAEEGRAQPASEAAPTQLAQTKENTFLKTNHRGWGQGRSHA